MDIIIGFSRAKSPWKIGSKIIRESEKREYSHAYVRFDCMFTGVSVVYQASLGMVNAYNFELFKEHNIVVEEYIIKDVDSEKTLELISFLQKNLGKPYSKKIILLLTIKKLLGFEVNYRDNNNEFDCSELAVKVVAIIKNVNFDINLDYVTPSDLNKIINQLQIPRFL